MIGLFLWMAVGLGTTNLRWQAICVEKNVSILAPGRGDAINYCKDHGGLRRINDLWDGKSVVIYANRFIAIERGCFKINDWCVSQPKLPIPKELR